MRFAAAAFWIAAALLCAATAPVRAQVLEIATDQSPVGLDPHVATSFATQLITSTVYEGLTAIDAGLHVVPALAQSWTVSDEGRTYLFQLRPGAAFHNGRALTPADVVASVLAALLVGGSLGVFAAWRGGWIDSITDRKSVV